MNELTSPEAVRAHYKEPYEMAVRKEIRHLDRHCRAFIAAAPFLVMATSDAEGRCDATPRGDDPGFVAVVDDKTLLIPDRRGNNRVDAMMNIGANPHVGLLFMVPGMKETLRVNGRATITVDATVLAPLAADGKPPQAAIKVDVEEVYFQCGKALVRSDLWNPERHATSDSFAPFGQVISDHCNVTYDARIDQSITQDYKTGLY